MDSTLYEEGSTVVVMGNTRDLARTDYTFGGWNRAADGSGTSYSPGDTMTMSGADVVLYAEWQAGSTDPDPDPTDPPSNVNLAALEVSPGVLTPGFSANVTSYYVWHRNGVLSTTVTPTVEDAAASITVNGVSWTSGDAFGPIGLAVGPSVLVVEVTGEDQTTTKTYTIDLYRAISLPKTGQTVSYETGDDGWYEKGVSWPSPRFTDNGDGTITDHLTGLMWDQTGDRFGSETWPSALGDCNDLVLGGNDDWRLPNRRELRSLMHYAQSSQAGWLNAPSGPFSSIQSDYHWTSTTYSSANSEAYAISLTNAYMWGDSKASDSRYVLAVRAGAAGGQVSLPATGQTTGHASGDDGDVETGVAWPDPRFTDNGDETVTDHLTGLVWDQNGNRFGEEAWASAVSDCYSLVLGGHSDWRLPNIHELESLIHVGEEDTYNWLNSEAFSNMNWSFYWTSTTHASATDRAISVSMSGGDNGSGLKTGSNYVIAVRDGP